MARILIISLTDLARDPRVDRQIRALGAVHELVVAGVGAPVDPGIEFIRLRPPVAATLRERVTVQTLRTVRRFGAAERCTTAAQHGACALQNVGADLVLANDVNALPLAFAAAHGRPVVVDVHEHAPSENADVWWWRFLIRPSVIWSCRTYLPKVAAMTTVCEGIADLYAAEFGVASDVVTNATAYADLKPGPVGTPIRLVHFGGADPQRRIENLIETMRFLDETYTLDLVLVGGPPGYVDSLKAAAAGDARIRFLPRIPMPELPAFANGYDIGLYPLPPVHPNQRLALPNKFFEFVQGRLAVAIGPSPEMARLAIRHDFGIVADDFSPESVATAIRETSRERLATLKANAHAAAEVLCAERQADVTRRVVADVLARELPAKG